MGDRSKIEWTDASWNPIRARSIANGKIGWHCQHVSEGCRNCYAESMNRWRGTGIDYKPGWFDGGDVVVFVDELVLLQPLRWRQPRMIFAGSMTDLFGDFVTDEMLDQIFAVMAASSTHQLQVLTKRPGRMRKYLSDPDLPRRIARAWCRVGRDTDKGWTTKEWKAEGDNSTPRAWPLPNVWLGTSCEDQATADARIPELLATPAAVRFVSAEPLLGPINVNRYFPYTWLNNQTGECGGNPGLDWVIVGGESGPHARPMHPQWARNIRNQCAAAGVAFHFKQQGQWAFCDGWEDWIDEPETLKHHWPDGTMSAFVRGKLAGRKLDGLEHNGMPEVRA